MKVAMGTECRGGRARTLAAWIAAALASGLLLTGCGNLPAGSATGETTVYVVGEGDDPAAAAPASSQTSVTSPTFGASSASGTAGSGTLSTSDPEWWGADLATSSAAEEPEGEIELEFDLELVRSDGTTVPLTDQEAQVEVELPGGPGSEIEVTTRVVDAGRYATLRVIFNEIDVWIDQGLIIDGQLVTGLIDVEIDNMTLVVDRAIDLNLEQGSSSELVVDMNATDWLEAVDPIAKTVDEAIVAEFIEVRVR